MEKVLELRLCETERLILKPNRLYLFTVDPQCNRCCKLAGLSAPLSTEYAIGAHVAVGDSGYHKVTSNDDKGWSFDIYLHGAKIGSGYSPHK